MGESSVGETRPIPSDVQGILDRMSDADWHRLILQLGRYALHKSRRFYWRTGNSGGLPCGEMTESIVSKALVLWLGGRRRWNRSEYDDLQAFLQGVIDSLLSHVANGYDNRHFEDRSADLDHALAASTTPEAELLARERVSQAEQTLAAIIQQSQQDAIVIAIIDAVRNGARTRRDIVRATGHSPDVIDNGLKRLRRAGSHVVQHRKS